MAVIIKSSNLAFLLKMGVSLEVVSKVKQMGILFVLGDKDFQFKSASGESLYIGMLPVSSSVLMVSSPPLLLRRRSSRSRRHSCCLWVRRRHCKL
jgi:hypothetical protein